MLMVTLGQHRHLATVVLAVHGLVGQARQRTEARGVQAPMEGVRQPMHCWAGAGWLASMTLQLMPGKVLLPGAAQQRLPVAAQQRLVQAAWALEQAGQLVPGSPGEQQRHWWT